jgi:putative chitinase
MIKSYRDFLLEGSSEDLNRTFAEYQNRLTDLLGSGFGVDGSNKSVSSDDDDDDFDDADVNTTGSGETGEVKSNFSGTKKELVDLVIKYLNKYKITNPQIQKAILSTIGKESGFEKFKETSYKGTSPARIREVFGKRFSGMSDEEINRVKQDDNSFWEKVYGGEWGRRNLGNTQTGDGAKYVGRGFNGITGRGNYTFYNNLLKKYGSKADILSNPDLLNTDKDVAAEVNALYFLNGLNDPKTKRKYGNSNQNDFQDFTTALKAAVNVNAGIGKDITKGFTKKSYDAAVAASNQFDIDTRTA